MGLEIVFTALISILSVQIFRIFQGMKYSLNEVYANFGALGCLLNKILCQHTQPSFFSFELKRFHVFLVQTPLNCEKVPGNRLYKGTMESRLRFRLLLEFHLRDIL